MIWIDSVWILRLGWTLVHFLWQGVAWATLLALMLWLAKGRSPRLRYGLACLVLAGMITTPVLTWHQLGRTSVPHRIVVASQGDWPLEPGGGRPALPVAANDSSTRTWEGFFPVVVGVWLLGVATMSLRLAGGWAWLQWLRRRPDTVPAADDLQLRLLRLCQRMSLVSNIRILLCEKVPGPTVMGWLRPVILLPPAALLGMPPDQMELVLAHELAHILRHDFAINLLQSCVEVLLFYHPAVWWVSAKIRQERELCCDDLAVRTTGDALDYAAALTRLEALCRPPDSPQHAAQALALGATGGSFMHRIRRLVSPMAPTPLAPRAGLVLVLLMSGILALRAGSATGQNPTVPPVATELPPHFVGGQRPPEGAMWLRRYDRDSADGLRRAGTIYVHVNTVPFGSLMQALKQLDQAPADPTKGYVDLDLKADPKAKDPHGLWTYLFLGADPVRVERVVQARATFRSLDPEDKKPDTIVIQRMARFTAQLGVIPEGLNVQVWAGNVPAPAVLQALQQLLARQPEAGIPQEVRVQVPPDEPGARITLDLK
ncbi:MAG TPA: M56 family metallopeptidase, partial [Geothrix sp.]|nr:M56 family metallopeptidase [Geothrix sp.]